MIFKIGLEQFYNLFYRNSLSQAYKMTLDRGNQEVSTQLFIVIDKALQSRVPRDDTMLEHWYTYLHQQMPSCK